jgi:hypothetical protein
MLAWPLLVVALYALGIYWCYEVIRRLPQDVQEIRQLKETTRRVAIVVMWIMTVVIAALLVVVSIWAIDRTTSLVRGLP